MISRFFIDRPIFATVLSVVITLIGGDRAAVPADGPVSRRSRRPASRSPSAIPGPAPRWWPTRWRPPSSSRSTACRACSTCRRRSGNDGTYTLTVTFDVGTDLNTALVDGAEPRGPGHAAIADAGPEPGNHDPEADARHPADRQLLFARRPLRRSLPEQLRHDPRPRRDAARGRAFRTSPTWASATTASASGSIRRRWRPAASPPWTWPTRSAARTSMRPPGRSASRRPRRPGLPVADRHLGRLSTPEQFGDIIVKVGHGSSPPPSATAAAAVQGGSGCRIPSPAADRRRCRGRHGRAVARHAVRGGTPARRDRRHDRGAAGGTTAAARRPAADGTAGGGDTTGGGTTGGGGH